MWQAVVLGASHPDLLLYEWNHIVQTSGESFFFPSCLQSHKGGTGNRGEDTAFPTMVCAHLVI